MTRRGLGAAIRANAANFRSADRDFDSTVRRDLPLQLFVKLALELAHFAALHASNVDVVARAVFFIEVAMSAQMEQIEFVDQTLALQQIDGSIYRNARDVRINFLRALQNFVSIQMPRRGFHYLQKDPALAGQTNAAGAQFALKSAWRLISIDSFAGGDAACGCCRHKIA